jgi:transketolase C-terminal domain/subunit
MQYEITKRTIDVGSAEEQQDIANANELAAKGWEPFSTTSITDSNGRTYEVALWFRRMRT